MILVIYEIAVILTLKYYIVQYEHAMLGDASIAEYGLRYQTN